MKIYAVADIHGRISAITRIKKMIDLHNPNVLVVAGDITHFTRAKQVLEALDQMPIPVMGVCGNTDMPWVEFLLNHHDNLTSLHLNKVTRQQVRFVGLNLSFLTPLQTLIPFWGSQNVKALFPLVDRHTVIVSHQPPKGILDEVIKCHTGCRHLRKLIIEKQPSLVICGHIHERAGTAPFDNTLVVNASIGRHGEGAIIELKGNEAPLVTMI